MNQQKPTHAKPSLYAHYFFALKEIAKGYGYNLIIHGSLQRDLDLIAIPWIEDVKPHEEMLVEFVNVIGGSFMYFDGTTGESKKSKISLAPHGRMCYTINLNRECGMVGGEWVDPQYYIDISVIPTQTSGR